jgi:hypothetical protein
MRIETPRRQPQGFNGKICENPAQIFLFDIRSRAVARFRGR